MTTDQIIASLAPSQSRTLTQTDSARVEVERSGDGKTIRFVRHTATGWVVFRTVRA